MVFIIKAPFPDMLFKVTLHLNEGDRSGRACSTVNGESEWCECAQCSEKTENKRSNFSDCLHKKMCILAKNQRK